MKIENISYQHLRPFLPYGSLKKIAKKNNLTTESIKQIIKGKWINDKVIKDFLNEIDEKVKNDKNLSEMIRGIIENIGNNNTY